jgi:TRAP-type C4-dicarboxylate transport system permease small subunit
MKVIRYLDRWLTRAEGALLVALLSVMVILAFGQVVLRNVFGTGIVWADTVIRHLVLWAGFIGGALATSAGRHISIDALTKFLPPRVRAGAQALTALFTAAVCAVLTNAAWTFLVDERSSGSILIFDIPTWVVLTIIPAGYVLVGIHSLVLAAEGAAQVAGHGGTKDA